MQPNLVLTADPDFLTLAIGELRQAHPAAEIVAEIAPGVITAVLPNSFYTLAEAWRNEAPIFVRHICPVQQSIPFENVTQLDTVVRQSFLPYIEQNEPFSVQTRIFSEEKIKPFAVNNQLAALIQQETNAPLDVKSPFQILSVVIETNVAHIGLSSAQQNLSSWAGGERRFAREKGQISRAEFKLLEAIDQFNIALPQSGAALDLGAAPGGWTRVLRQHGVPVTAVDPAKLHPSLQHDTAVRHHPITAEKYLAQTTDTFALIVNDMRLDARDSARLMVAFAPRLQPDGDLIMTLKLPSVNAKRPLTQALHILQEKYNILHVRQLFHNRHEVTVYGRLR